MTTENTSTDSRKYQISFGYDNDKQLYIIPSNPETIKLSVSGNSESITLNKLGEIIAKGRRGAISVSFSSFFPKTFGESYCQCKAKDFKTPKEMISFIRSLEGAENPCHFVMNTSPASLNIYAVITKFTYTEDGGDPGTIQYSIELKEFREPKVRTYKKTATEMTVITTQATRTSNKKTVKYYTVKKGDTLGKIAKKCMRKNTKSNRNKIYAKNKTVIEKAAKKHKRKSSGKGKYLYSGTKLTIPNK